MGGRLLYTPLRGLVMSGCCPMGLPSMCLWVINTAYLMALIDLCCRPWSQRLAKNSRKCQVPAETGSTCPLAHQLAHLDQPTLCGCTRRKHEQNLYNAHVNSEPLLLCNNCPYIINCICSTQPFICIIIIIVMSSTPKTEYAIHRVWVY